MITELKPQDDPISFAILNGNQDIFDFSIRQADVFKYHHRLLAILKGDRGMLEYTGSTSLALPLAADEKFTPLYFSDNLNTFLPTNNSKDKAKI